MTTAALVTISVAVAIIMTALRLSKRKEKATTHGKDTRTENLIKVEWRWPQWRKDFSEALNHIHRHQLSLFKQQEKIMAQGEDLKTGMAALKAEVGEAVAKFNEIKAKLDAALADDADTAALKEAATEVSAEMGAITQHLDEAFGTQFTQSGQ